MRLCDKALAHLGFNRHDHILALPPERVQCTNGRARASGSWRSVSNAVLVRPCLRGTADLSPEVDAWFARGDGEHWDPERVR